MPQDCHHICGWVAAGEADRPDRTGRDSDGERVAEDLTVERIRCLTGDLGRPLAWRAELLLTALAGWHFTKFSKIEAARQGPSDADIRLWCRFCHAEDQVQDLIASRRNIDAQYIEWRRALRAGTKRRQELQRRWEHESQLVRIYESLLIPGILQTPAYATKIVSTAVSFYEIPDDVEQSVETRLARADALYHGARRFHIIVAEQALRTRLGSIEMLQGQLGRVLEASTLTRLRLGIVPADAVYEVWPIDGFWIFDQRMVGVEIYAAELTVTQPREIGLYEKAFDALGRAAVYGQAAWATVLRSDATASAWERRTRCLNGGATVRSWPLQHMGLVPLTAASRVFPHVASRGPSLPVGPCRNGGRRPRSRPPLHRITLATGCCRSSCRNR